MKTLKVSLVATALLASVLLNAGNTPTQAPEEQTLVRPVVLVRVLPEYPAEMLSHQQEGRVLLQTFINAQGDVLGVRVLEATHPEFGQAAARAVRQWEFSPAMKNGKAVEIVVNIPLRFVLDKGTNIPRVLTAGGTS